ncbi:hypothetical protein ACFSC6_11115 [Rufibacter sediminis]|uniref:Uncharacterized protein n=1 Tax=Rufibacter sediminis TaxID=2762756 RepID=A0ABR6VTF8_9BACT|nr:hypothetical protein [Rufibacter sediminis]MBC3540430.1 hypothetical protein [Rufibacter sediminis]
MEEHIAKPISSGDLLIGVICLVVAVFLILAFWHSVYSGFLDSRNFKGAIFSFLGNGLVLGLVCYGLLIGLYKMGIPRLGDNGEIAVMGFIYLFFYFLVWIIAKRKLEDKYGVLTLKSFLGFLTMCISTAGMLYLIIKCERS